MSNIQSHAARLAQIPADVDAGRLPPRNRPEPTLVRHPGRLDRDEDSAYTRAREIERWAADALVDRVGNARRLRFDHPSDRAALETLRREAGALVRRYAR